MLGFAGAEVDKWKEWTLIWMKSPKRVERALPFLLGSCLKSPSVFPCGWGFQPGAVLGESSPEDPISRRDF